MLCSFSYPMMEENMGFLEFLNVMENTLNTIEVKGRQNINSLYACLNAIDEMRSSIVASMREEMAKKQDVPVGGDEVGRQSDIGTESGSNSNGE